MRPVRERAVQKEESEMKGYRHVSTVVVAMAMAVLTTACAASTLPPTPVPTDTVTPAATAAPTPSLSPSASPSTAARQLPTSGDVALDAGTYYVADSTATNAQRLTFTLPAGWTTADLVAKNSGKPGEVFFTTWVVTDVFTDVCHWGTLVHAGTTTDDVISALAAQRGRTASAPSDVTIGGYPAKRIELTVPADLNVSTCTNSNLRYWPGPGPDLSSGLCCNPPGNIDDVYVVDIAGRRMVVVARFYPGSSEADKAELQSVVASIQIEPLPPLPTPSASASR
jgi:hypothetical protein